jgi:hypothetical protein
MTAKAASPMTDKTPQQPDRIFLLAVTASLLAGILLMFGSLMLAATRMQVTM